MDKDRYTSANNNEEQHAKENENITFQFKVIVALACLLIIVVTLVLNIFFMESLYELGVNIIYDSQHAIKSSFVVFIQNIFSMFCHPSTVGVLLVIQFLVARHKFKAIIHVSFFLLTTYFIAILKQAYQQSRPIWSSDQIQKLQWWCPKDFGNPSGHSFAVFPLYQPLISKYIGFQNCRTGWIFLVVFGFFVPFSRMYLGVHSLNQVLFGLTLGVSLTVLYRYAWRKMFYHWYSRIYKLKKFKYLIVIVTLHLFMFFLPFIFFEINSQNRPMEAQDINNLNKFCATSLSSLLIQQSMLLKCTLESFVFGWIYALYFMQVTDKQKMYFTGQWKYQSTKAMFLYLLTFLAVVGVIAAIFIVLLPHLIKNTLLDYIINTIGMVGAGFGSLYVVSMIQKKQGWIIYNKEYQKEQMINNNQFAI